MVANEQQLASARAVDEARDLIAVLKADKVRLQAEEDELHGLLYKIEVTCVNKVEDATTKLEIVDQTKGDTSKLVVRGTTTDGTCHALAIVKSESDVDIASSEDEETPSFKHPKGLI